MSFQASLSFQTILPVSETEKRLFLSTQDVDALGPVKFNPTEVKVKKKVPFFDLKVSVEFHKVSQSNLVEYYEIGFLGNFITTVHISLPQGNEQYIL